MSMCMPAIVSGEESCRDCPGYTTCPNSAVWEDAPCEGCAHQVCNGCPYEDIFGAEQMARE